MKPEEKDKLQKPQKPKSSIVLYTAASIVTLIAIALLVNNILLYINTLSSYVAQGYPAADVMKQLIPSQLVPGIFEPVALYGGIASALFGIGIINKKSSECIMALLNRDDDYRNAPDEGITGTEDNSDNKV